MKTTLQNVQTAAGYNHPTGTIAGHSEPLAPLGNENKRKYAAMCKASQMKRAALRAAGLDHPDTVEIAGRVYDLRKMPTQRRASSERLARITTAPTAAIRLKCYECSGYNAIEAGACNCRDCALWVLRHNRDARKQEATAGELGRASDDVETGADETENSAAEEE